jgi:hypothetical protein
MGRKIVVEARVRAPVAIVWERTQTPDLHVSWDIRFTHIRYLEEKDERGYNVMDYRTNIALGITVKGFGHYLHSTPLRLSTFEFDSHDWKSLITRGRGIWKYTPQGDAEDETAFKTVYDYDVRYGLLGRILDWLFFRRLLQLATEWGFETLRLWCGGDETALARRASRLRFGLFFLARYFKKPAPGAARSWLAAPGQE